MASSASKSASAAVTSTARFACPAEQLRDVARAVLQRARDKGASACEVEVSEGYGQTVTVRRKNIDTIEYNRDKGIGVTVYLGQRKGYASSSDFSASALADTVDAALSIARFTAEDDAAGLAPDERLCRSSADLDLFHPWDPSVEHAAELARRILPLCTPTTIYANATLRTWIHYIQVRTDPSTQLEHRLIAEECKRIFAIQFPVIAAAAFSDAEQVDGNLVKCD